jgi:uncharacterized protein involved in outer membrane biogenesis
MKSPGFFGRKKIGYKTWLSLALALSLIGLALVLLPEWVRYYSLKQLRSNLETQVSIGDVDLNLFTGRAKVSDLVIGGRSPNQPPILRLPRLEIDYSLFELLQGRVHLDQVRLFGADAFLERTGPARFNVMALAKPSENGREDNPSSWDFTIEQLAVRNGKITLVDQTVEPVFKRELRDVTFQAGTISSLPELKSSPTSFELVVRVDHGSIVVEGKAIPTAQPFGLDVTARWQNIDPSIFAAYLPERPVIDFSDGELSGNARYTQSDSGDLDRSVTVSFESGPVALRPVAGEEPLLRSKELRIREARWDLVDQRGEVAGVELIEPHLLLERPEGGSFTVARLFSADEQALAAEEQEKTPGLPFTIHDLRVEEGSVKLSDRGVTPAVEGTLTNLQARLNDLTLTPEAEPGRLTAEALLESAEIRVDGKLKPIPFDAQLSIASTALPLNTLQGYLQAGWNSPLEWQGNLDGQVELGLAAQKDDLLAVDLSGRLEARDLSLEVPGAPEAPIQAGRLATTITGLRTEPQLFVDIENVELVSAYFRVARGPNGKWNLNPLLKAPSEQDKSTKSAAQPFFRIGRLTAKESMIQFIDENIDPSFRTSLSNLAIETGSLGSEEKRTPVSIRGKLNETAELELKGWIKAFSGPLQISLDGTMRDYDLDNLNPYSTKYIRYEIERGRLTTDVEYSYDTGDLSGNNEIAIRQLRLGERLGDEFEEQIGISLKLALALLEDADGSIRLRVPVTGDLRKPEFDLSALVWKAVRNALAKALSAPLRALGSLVTLGGKITEVRIDPLAFQPGSLELSDGGKQRVDELAALLKGRPRLELEVRGTASRKELPGLKQRLLREKIGATGEAYKQSLSRLYRLSQPGDSVEKSPSTEEMETFLAESLVPSPNALANLAEQRANFVESTLLERGVAPEKLYVVPEKIRDDRPGRVEFELLS